MSIRVEGHETKVYCVKGTRSAGVTDTKNMDRHRERGKIKMSAEVKSKEVFGGRHPPLPT